MRPYAPIPRFVSGTDHAHLIQRCIRPGVDPATRRIDLITTTTLRLSLLDSGSSPQDQTAEGDTIIHVLWQMHEPDAWISISGETFPIAPGDSVGIPAGDSWTLSPDQLVVSISRRAHAMVIPLPPTHGTDRFVGHNRETSPAGMSLSRWKLTEPLTLEATSSDRILVSLYADIAVQYPGGVTMLRQGQASVIRPGTERITLVPNGLSYVLVID